MIAKTEMVSVPRELLAAWAERFSRAQIFKESSEVRAILAAPAEDVRAVVDEPVGQWSDDEGLSWCDGNERSLQSALESGWMTRTLYRHPQSRLEMADVVKAHLDIPGCPVLTSNQCHTIAMKLNARLSPQ